MRTIPIHYNDAIPMKQAAMIDASRDVLIAGRSA